MTVFWPDKAKDKSNRVVQRILASEHPRWSVLHSVYKQAAEIIRNTGRSKQPEERKEKLKLIQQMQRLGTDPQWQQWLAVTVVLR